MTTAIVVLVLASIIVSIGCVSVVLYVRLHDRALQDIRAQEINSLGAAATILAQAINGSSVNWTQDGYVASIQAFAIPPLYDTKIVDDIGRTTKQEVGIFVVDKATQAVTLKSTTLLDAAGAGRIQGVGLSGSTLEALMSGHSYVGDLSIGEQDLLGAIVPVDTPKGELVGAIMVGVPTRVVAANANDSLVLVGTVGVLAVVCLGALGFLLSRAITRPIRQLSLVMRSLADGRYDVAVPYLGYQNDAGEMAAAVEVFRSASLRVREMTEAEAHRISSEASARRAMLDQLQESFGAIVERALAGDFAGRVTDPLGSAELAGLANSMNRLIASFDRGMTEVTQVLARLANSKIGYRVAGDHEGAFATLKSDVNAVGGNFARVVGALQESLGDLKAATAEILLGTNDLSERTSRQAKTIGMTTTAMEALAGTVTENAKLAREASDVADGLTRSANDGGEAMRSATDAMSRILQNSNSISSIVDLIDDIAFQTNLLALNASVEAARAGDAGKGFSVVAVEVRRLAQSAARASAEVKGLVESSADDVQRGSGLVAEAAKRLDTIVEAAHASGRLVSTISRESIEQAGAIEEMTAAMRALDEVTQHNAALVEEINAALEQAEKRVGELDEIAGVFDLSDPGIGLGAPDRHARATDRSVA